MKKVLVIGSGGQVSTELSASKPGWCVLDVAGRATLDLAKTHEIRPFIAASKAELVINAAAYTAVDKAEGEEELANLINAVAPGELALGTADLGIPLIHISTDYVFNGESRRPYNEDDTTAPLGVYGTTKRAGEQAVAANNPRHVIARTAWVYSAHGHNFVKSMLRLGAKHERLAIVSDQLGSPTSAGDLAHAIWQIAERLLANDARDDFGIVNIAGTDIASWYDFARAVFAISKAHGGPDPEITPILTEDYPTPARRPANSRLDTKRLERHFGITMPPWRNSLEDVLHELRGLD